MTLVTPGQQLTLRARERGGETAMVFARLDGSLESRSWDEVESQANSAARSLRGRGVKPGAFVVVGLPNGLDHLVAAQAIWKLGGCVVPIAANLPVAERDRMLSLASAAAVVADWPDVEAVAFAGLLGEKDGSPLDEDPVPAPYKAIASGGSTGAPKLIVTPGAFAYPEGDHPLGALVGIADRSVVLSPGPLYHNQAFLFSAICLYQGGTAVVCERFSASLTIDLIARLGVTYLNAVPTMLSRMLRTGTLHRGAVVSLQTVFHMAAPCPEWVKRGWIELVGAERVYELWGSTEMAGITVVRGDEWLERPGTVGRPVLTDLRVLGEDGAELPPGEVGEIHGKMLLGDGPTYEYRGTDPLPETGDGLVSVGDLGWVDEDGYLYLADRRTDLILSGGANVYPAEVEAALSSHPGLADVAVVGLPDDDLGQTVHAVVQPSEPGAPPTIAELDAHCRERLAKYKVPRTYAFVDSLPRTDSGKLRRAALRDGS